MGSDRHTLHHLVRRPMSRRRVLAAGAAALLPLSQSLPARAAQGTPANGATPEVAEQLGQLTVIRENLVAAGDPQSGGDLRVALRQAGNSNFNPVAFEQDFQIPVSYLDPLTRPNPLTLAPEPWLAESWEWNADDTVITYQLRSGVTWHDGTPLTADDVRFSLFVARDDIFSEVRNFFVLMDNVEAPDALTLRVFLNAKDNTWLFNASSLSIFQREQYTDYWSAKPFGERTLNGFDWAESSPVGTGPWQVEAFDENCVTMTRNEGYWAGAPFAESLSLPVIPEEDDRVRAWVAGEVDVLWPVPPGSLDTLSERAGSLYVSPSASVMFAAFNFQNPTRIIPGMLADPALREALNLAVDRTGYADEVFKGFIAEDRAGTVAQPWANAEDVINPPRDVERAQALLAASGWQDFDRDGILDDVSGQRLALVTIVRDDAAPELIAVLNRVATDLEAVGATLDVQVLDVETFRDRWINAHDFDLIAYSYGLFPGFTDFDLYGAAWDVRINSQGWNPGGYRNLEVDQAILELFDTVAPETQVPILEEIQELTNSDLFGLWFGFPNDLVAVQETIAGFERNLFWQTAETRLMWRRGGGG